MRFLLVTLALSTLHISLAACSRGSDVTPTAAASTATAPVAPAAAAQPAAATFSCDRRKADSEYAADTCIDFSSDAVEKGQDYMKRPCGDPAAVFGQTPCPTEKLVATCESKAGKNLFRYYGGGKMSFTAESAKKQCTELYGGRIL
jgi:hypothetical protein